MKMRSTRQCTIIARRLQARTRTVIARPNASEDRGTKWCIYVAFLYVNELPKPNKQRQHVWFTPWSGDIHTPYAQTYIRRVTHTHTRMGVINCDALQKVVAAPLGVHEHCPSCRTLPINTASLASAHLRVAIPPAEEAQPSKIVVNSTKLQFLSHRHHHYSLSVSVPVPRPPSSE